MMTRKKSRMDLIDSGYNRYTWNDPEDLPDWFAIEEKKYTKPELPVSKELMDEYRRKLREINARPIRKVAEAQARNQKRMALRLARVRKTAKVLQDQEELSNVSKMKQVKRMMRQVQNKSERVTVYSAVKKGGGNVSVGK